MTKKEKKKIFNVQLEKMHYILKKVNVCPRGKKEKRKIFMQCISNIDICSKQTIKVSAPISTGINNKHVMSDNPPCTQGNLGCGQREKKNNKHSTLLRHHPPNGKSISLTLSRELTEHLSFASGVPTKLFSSQQSLREFFSLDR